MGVPLIPAQQVAVQVFVFLVILNLMTPVKVSVALDVVQAIIVRLMDHADNAPDVLRI